MQEILHDGTVGPVKELTPGQELTEVLQAAEQKSVAMVRVGEKQRDGRLKVRATVVRGKAKLKPRRWKKKKKKRRKAARASRKKNRGRR